MIRVGDPKQYFRIQENGGIQFRGVSRRTVRLTVNAPYETRIFYQYKDTDGEAREEFIALVKGLELVEFVATGDFMLCADATCYVRSTDGDDVALRYPDARSFTQVTERRPQNPELERFMHMMRINEQRRMQHHEAQLQRMRDENAREREAFIAAQNTVRDSQKVPEPPTGSGVDIRDDKNTGEGTNDGSDANSS